MAHQGNAGLVVEAGGQLDEAVKVGQSFAESDPETLVIVAADHETGGLAIEDTNEIQRDPAYPNESGAGRTEEDGPFGVAGSDKKFLVDWTTTNSPRSRPAAWAASSTSDTPSTRATSTRA